MADKKEKSVEACKSNFDIWREKKDKELLKLFLEKEKAEEGFSKSKKPEDIAKEISNLRSQISQKEASTYRAIARLLTRAKKAGSSTDAKDARRERTHHLCNLGGLVEKAGLGNLEPSTLLGMLLQQAEYLRQHPEIENRWKVQGQELLKQGPKSELETA